MNETEVRELTTILMAKHHLMRDGWMLKIGRAVRQAGSCNRSRKTITISGSIAKLNSKTEVQDTILHEIAHALAPRGSQHGSDWQEIAVKVGARPERCMDANLPVPPARYIGTCPNGHTVESIRMRRCSCGKCSGGKFNLKFLIRWTQNPEWSKP